MTSIDRPPRTQAADNYDRQMDEVIRSLGGRRPSLLLQVCCAPCACGVLPRITEHFDVTMLFYNPNIKPREEYEKRLAEVSRLRELLFCARDIELFEPSDSFADFDLAIRGMEDEPEGGARCTRCFQLRLGETARVAAGRDFEYFCTTLTVSPHKDARLINVLGQELGEMYGVKWLPSDFKKRDGYRNSVLVSKGLGIYRQRYCGCTPLEGEV